MRGMLWQVYLSFHSTDDTYDIIQYKVLKSEPKDAFNRKRWAVTEHQGKAEKKVFIWDAGPCLQVSLCPCWLIITDSF